jgi:hypothetical protein
MYTRQSAAFTMIKQRVPPLSLAAAEEIFDTVAFGKNALLKPRAATNSYSPLLHRQIDLKLSLHVFGPTNISADVCVRFSD